VTNLLSKSKRIAALIALALALAACGPATGDPLPRRQPGRVVLFTFSGNTIGGGQLQVDVLFTLAATDAEGKVVHQDPATKEWVPGPDIRPGLPTPFEFQANLSNLIISASATAEYLADAGDTLTCTATEGGAVISQSAVTAPENLAAGALFPMVVVCTA
jgi:hypothetical protein